jgi:hypothetical protein
MHISLFLTSTIFSSSPRYRERGRDLIVIQSQLCAGRFTNVQRSVLQSLLSSPSILRLNLLFCFCCSCWVVFCFLFSGCLSFFHGDLYTTTECRVELGRGFIVYQLKLASFSFFSCVCLQNTNDNNINNNVGIKESKSQTPILPIDRITAGDCKYIFHLFFKTKKKGKSK